MEPTCGPKNYENYECITLLLCVVNYFLIFKYIFKLNITRYKHIIYIYIIYKFKIVNYLFMTL